LDAESARTRKEQSFFVSVEDIRANEYDLTFNKYKEVERKVVEYDEPATILTRIKDLQTQISDGLNSLQSLIK
jgi:type I restriction enzyme M protein